MMRKLDPVLKQYKKNFPWHAFATDDFTTGLRFYEGVDALKLAFTQHNPKHSIKWLVYDIDTSTATTDWIDQGMPAPNIMVINRENGHAHLFYGLEVPVHKYPGASEKALRYAGSIDIALTMGLGADQDYAKFISKNPLHKRWTVVIPHNELYTLDELSKNLDLYRLLDRRRNLPAIGHGRNCNLFHTLRRWAYTERRKPQQYLSYDMFREACTWRAHAINREFPTPLSHGEIRGAAKSVAKWTWSHMSAAGFKAWADSRREKSIQTRKARSEVLRDNILEAVRQCPDLTQTDIAAMLGVSQQRVSQLLKSAPAIDSGIPSLRQRDFKSLLSDITN